MDKKYYRTGAEIVLILGLMVSLGVNVVDTDEGYIPYSCDKETVPDMMCYKLSRIGKTTGIHYYCYYDRDNPRKAKACSTGWKRLTNVDDYQQECPKTTCPICPICTDKECSTCDICSDNENVQVIAYVEDESGLKKYFCDGIGYEQNCISDDTIEMPFW